MVARRKRRAEARTRRPTNAEFLIERNIPGAGDKVYCVYVAPDADAVREHARRGGFPADRVSEISTTIDPATAE